MINAEEVINDYLKNKENFHLESLFKNIENDFDKSQQAYLVALNCYDKNFLELTEKLFEFSLKLLEKLDKKFEISALLHSFAGLKFKEKLIDEAKLLFKKSLSIKKEINDNIGICLLLKDLAYLEEFNNNINEAIRINKESIKYLLQENLLDDLLNTFLKLIDLDQENKNNYLGQALYISLNNNLNIESVFLLVVEFTKSLGIENEFIPLIISTLNLVYTAKNNITPEISKTFLELISTHAFLNNIENISEWIKKKKFDDVELSFKKLENFINSLITENFIYSDKI